MSSEVSSEYLASDNLMTTQLNEAIKCLKGYHGLSVCDVNMRRKAFPDIIFNNTGHGSTCKFRDGALKFSAADSMNPGQVTNCLRAYIEQITFAQKHSMIYTIRQQYE